MKRTVLITILASGLAACDPASMVKAQTVKVWKPDGSVSCDPASGMSVATIQQQLTNAKINVKSSGCGHDGLVRASVCGIETGRVIVFEIDGYNEAKARTLGFQTFADIPAFTAMACTK